MFSCTTFIIHIIVNDMCAIQTIAVYDNRLFIFFLNQLILIYGFNNGLLVPIASRDTDMTQGCPNGFHHLFQLAFVIVQQIRFHKLTCTVL